MNEKTEFIITWGSIIISSIVLKMFLRSAFLTPEWWTTLLGVILGAAICHAIHIMYRE